MSKALNELKKATMASYLAKAGGVLRADTKIGLDFENDAYKDMAVANKHHPNMVTPGFEKSPEKLAKAEKSMKTNFDLAKTFKRGANNRIKGIARAGRLLAKEGVELTKKGTPRKPATGIQKAAAAGTLGKELNAEIKKAAYKPTLMDKIKSKLRKEETINERNTESHPSLWNTHELRHDSGKVLKKGDVVKDFRGDKHKIKGFELPHHSGSTGRVYTSQGSFFPGVVDAKIVKKKAVKEETVNEVSRSTIAKVATARYNQAQAALKQKDFGGYVKKMGKAIKAADKTTPNSGWSPEDDPKNEEVIPAVSAQERYRQIREAKVRKAVNEVRVTHAQAQKSTTTHHNFYVPHDDLKKASKVLAKRGIPHNVADHSDVSSVEHSVISVSHKHHDNADETLRKHNINFGGRGQ